MRNLSKASKNLRREVGINFSAIGKAGAAAVGVGLALTIREGIKEFAEAQKASAQTAAALQSTGLAGVHSVAGIERMSGALMRMSGIDDQVIQGGQNILLTFGKVASSKSMLDRATKAALDLSVAFGKDMSSSSVMVGKALQDPVKGVSALTRVGVSFTQQQKDTIKSLVESGKTVEAQKIVFGELEKQVGGSAAAYGKTLPGQLGKLKESFAGLAADLVARFVPGVLSAMSSAQGFIDRVKAWSKTRDGQKAIGEVSSALTRLKQVVGAAGGVLASVAGKLVAWRGVLIPVASGVLAIVAAMKAYRIALAAATLVQAAFNVVLMANPLGLVVLAVIGIGAALVVAYKRSEKFRNIVNKSFRMVKGAAQATWNWIKSAWSGLSAAVSRPIVSGIEKSKRAFEKIKGAVNTVIAFVKSHWKMVGLVLVAPFIGLPVLLATLAVKAAKAFVSAFKKWFKMPSVSVSMKKKGKIPYPDFDIKWNKAGGVYTKATLFGAGEAGAEAIVPLDKYAITKRDLQGAGGGITVHGGVHIHANNAAGGRAAADAFLKTLQNSRQRQRTYNPRLSIGTA
jgi:gas vesicle protein